MLHSQKGWDEVCIFLWKLNDCFLWTEYEKDLATRNKEGERRSPFYTTALYCWLLGMPTNVIITRALDHKKKNPKEGVWLNGNKIDNMYNYRDKYHVNYVIADTLSTLDNLIQYKLSNYLQCFSNTYRIIHGEDPENDWSEFISFGTMDEQIIELQKLGFSRETARTIKDNFAKYCCVDNKRILLKSSLFEVKDDSVLEEVKLVKVNNPSRFID